MAYGNKIHKNMKITTAGRMPHSKTSRVRRPSPQIKETKQTLSLTVYPIAWLLIAGICFTPLPIWCKWGLGLILFGCSFDVDYKEETK